MPYLALDDNFPENPKVTQLSDRAFRLHIVALCHCSQHLTDGFISESAQIWTRIGTTKKINAQLVKSGLWKIVDGGWQIHDYLEWNASAAQVKAKRARDRQRKREKSFGDSARNPDRNGDAFHADSAGSAPRESSKELSLSGEPAKSARQRRTKPSATAAKKNLDRALAFIRNAGHGYDQFGYEEEIERFNLDTYERHQADELYATLTQTAEPELATVASTNGHQPDLFADTEPEEDE